MSSPEETVVRFADLGLHPQVLRSLEDVGYETPTPIQARIIPLILSGRDVLGQAQTGTGKTAAFALPLLSKLDLSVCLPQILVLAPTRELAGQVAEAFAKYGAHLPDLRVVPIYGGQEYGPQLRQLARGAHVVIGTPGRVIDHIERGTLVLEKLFGLVLDEADEMLKMGFKEDVERILQETPGQRQIALFSATLPGAIRTLAKTYMSEPEEVTIKSRTTTVETTRQRYWLVSRYHKLDALSRIIEMEPFDAMLIFVRTKIETIELSEQLAARGFASVPLNGDIPQNQRERTVEQLRSGKVNIVIATDVAARGLDVDRISHVINYDLPYDTESYIHRIGRTGRAGRSGEAILFVAPRERHLLRVIEQATRQKIELLELPTIEAINEKRISGFKTRIAATLNDEAWNAYLPIVTEFSKEAGVPPLEVAAALALMSQNGRSFLLTVKAEEESATEAFEKASRLKDERRKRLSEGKEYREIRAASAELLGKPERPRRERPATERKPRIHRDNEEVEPGMTRYRIEVGRRHMVKPGQIVGAIAGETGIDSSHIGRIVLHDEFSTVDLPEEVFASSFGILSKTWVAGQRLRISRFDPAAPRANHPAREEHGHATPDETDRPRHHHKQDRYDTAEKAADRPRRARTDERSEKPDRPASPSSARPVEKKSYGSYRDKRQGKHDQSAESGARPSKAPFHADSRRKATDGKAGWTSPKSKRPKDR